MPQCFGLRQAACGAEREDEDNGAVTNGTDALGIVSVDAHLLVVKGGDRRVC